VKWKVSWMLHAPVGAKKGIKKLDLSHDLRLNTNTLTVQNMYSSWVSNLKSYAFFLIFCGFGHDLRYYPSINLEGLKKTKKKPCSHDSV
jgi:hypothetical protein